MILPSASELTRALACFDSVLLTPQVHTSSVASERGDDIHHFIKRIGQGATRESALEEIPEENRPACEQIPIDVIPRGGKFEIALAWHSITKAARVLGEDLKRDYSGADRSLEFVGSFDYLGELRPGVGALLDWKSGWLTIRAKESWQLLLGAIAGAKIFGWTTVIVGHLDLRDTSLPRWDTHELDLFALAAAEQRLMGYAERFRAAVAAKSEVRHVVEGQHCLYCPAKGACPAKQAMLRSLPLTVHAASALTPELARESVLFLEGLEPLLKRAWEELEGYAAEHPIDLGDGRVMKLAPGQEKDKIKDSGAVMKRLTSILGEAHAAKAVTVSKASIERSCASFAKENDEEVAPLKRAVIKDLQGSGLIKKEAGAPSVRIVKGDA